MRRERSGKEHKARLEAVRIVVLTALLVVHVASTSPVEHFTSSFKQFAGEGQ